MDCSNLNLTNCSASYLSAPLKGSIESVSYSCPTMGGVGKKYEVCSFRDHSVLDCLDVCSRTHDSLSDCRCGVCRRRKSCPRCASALSNCVCWHDVDLNSRELLPVPAGIADCFLNVGYDERVGIIESLSLLDVDPVMWVNTMKGIYHELADVKYNGIQREVSDCCGWCVLNLSSRPDWDDKFELSGFRPGMFFQLFSMNLRAMGELFFIHVPKIEREVDAESLYLSLCSWNSEIPLSWRWAALRAFTIMLGPSSSSYDYLHDRVDVLQAICVEIYPTLVRPESAVSDAFTWFVDTVRSVFELFSGLASSTGTIVIDVLRDIVARCIKKPLMGFSHFSSWLTDGLLDHAKKGCGAAYELLKEFLTSPLVILCFKTMVRWWIGYSILSMTVEILWDRSLGKILELIIHNISDIFSAMQGKKIAPLSDGIGVATDTFSDDDAVYTAESGAAQSASLVISLLLASFSTFGKQVFKVDPRHCSDLLRNIYTAVCTTEKVGLSDAIDKFKAYLSGVAVGEEERMRLQAKYPATWRFYDAHVEYVSNENPTHSNKHDFMYIYTEYLKERRKWDNKDCPRLQSLVAQAVRDASNLGSVGNFEYRVQPKVFVFCGPPGIGKSVICETAACRLASHYDPDVKHLADVVYTFATNDAYQSGYTNQCIWRFDELFQKVDSPNDQAPDMAILLDMCSNTPFHLNMADVESKGKLARCYITLAASNLDLVGENVDSLVRLRPHVKSIKSAEAIRRRLSYVILPIVQEPYVYNERLKAVTLNGTPIVPSMGIKTQDLYRFRIYDVADMVLRSPTGKEIWTWNQLLVLMKRDLDICSKYVPGKELLGGLDCDDTCADDDIETEFGDAEGFGDWWPFIGAAAVGTAAFVGTSGILSKKKCPWDFFPSYTPCDCVKGGCQGEETIQRANFGCDEPVKTICRGWDEAGSALDTITDVYIDDVGHADSFDALIEIDSGDYPVYVYTQIEYGDLLKIKGPFKIYTGNSENLMFGMRNNSYYCLQYARCTRKYPHKSQMELRLMHAKRVVRYLTVPAILCLAGAAVAHKVIKKAKVDDEDEGVVIVDGKAHEYDPDTMSYVPQATERTRAKVWINGKLHWKILTKDGYKFYLAQGSESTNAFISLLSRSSSQRALSQLPSIKNSLWAVTRDGELLGNAFAIDARTLLTPRHVATMMVASTCVLKNGDLVRPFCPIIGDEKNVVVEKVPGAGDLVFLHMFCTKLNEVLPGCRKQATKFKKEIPQTGFCSLMARDVNGQLVVCEGNYVGAVKNVSYEHGGQEYVVECEDVRKFDGVSKPGYCGGVYIEHAGDESELCFGIHIARGGEGSTNYGVIHLVRQDQLKPENNYPSSSNLVLDTSVKAESGGMLSDAGITFVGKSPHKPLHRNPTRKQKTMFYQPLDCKFDLAPLHSVQVSEDPPVFCDPMRKSLLKLGLRVSEPQVGKGGLFVVAVALAQAYAPIYQHCKRELPSFQEVVTHELGLPSVNKRKSAGDPYYAFGGTKALAFLKEGDSHELTPEFLDFLLDIDRKLAPHDWVTRESADFELVEAVGNGTLKDEARAIQKVLEVKTRLFISVSLHEFLLQRRYYSDIVYTWSTFNVSVSSALGIAPDDFDILHDHLSSAGPGAVVLATDQEHMDGRVRPRMVRLVMIFVMHMTQAFCDAGRNIDPLIPKVSRRGFMMARLLYRIAWFILKIGDAECELGAMHPSGSFLTSFINHVAQDILVIWCLSEMLCISVLEAIELCPRVFLGDDSLIAIPAALRHKVDVARYKELMYEQGFVVTPSEKEGDITIHELWDGKGVSTYQFLSRKFCDTGAGIKGVLDPEKVEKIVSFSEKGKMQANLPMQFLSFIEEAKRGWTCPWYDSYREKWCRTFDVIKPNFLINSVTGLLDVEAVQFAVLGYLRESIDMVRPEGGGNDEQPMVSAPDATTTFVSNVVGDSDDSHPAHRGEEWRMAGMESVVHGDTDVFNRPVAIIDDIWDASSSTTLQSFMMPSSFFTGNPNAQGKLANYAFLHAVAVVKVVITSSPYTAGKAILGVRPLVGRYNPTIYEVAACPSVEIDASSGKEVELRVPCVLPHGFSMITNYKEDVFCPYFDWANFFLMVVSPVADVTDTPVHYRVYAWLEETRLFGPTNFSVANMAEGKGDIPVGGPQMYHKETLDEMRVNPFTVNMGSQVSGPPKVSESNRVSAGIDKYVTPTIKAIGGVLVEVGTIVLMGAKIAMLMGLSVPNITNNTTLVQDVRNFDGHHFSGACPALHLAGSQAQKVVLPVNTFSIHGDEMNISHYCSRFGYVGTIRWTADRSPGYQIAYIQINPGLCHVDGTTTPSTYHWNPLAFCSSFFQFWRGSIVYRFAAAKTKFHSGIIEIVWCIGNLNANPSSDQEAANCYRVVWNLAESASFQFTVPYISCLPWGVCRWLDINAFDNSINCVNGALHVRIVTPLISASNLVTDGIDILLYVAGGPDIEFSVPAQPSVIGNVPGPFKSQQLSLGKSKEREKEEEPKFCKPKLSRWFKAEGKKGKKETSGVYQRDDTSGIGEQNTEMMLGRANKLDAMGRIACIGEEIFNLRSLTRRFGSNAIVTTFDGTESAGHIGTQEMLSCHTIVRRLAYSFAYFSGGTRFELIPVYINPTEDPKLFGKSVVGVYVMMNGKPLDGAAVTFQPIECGTSYVFGIPYQQLTPYLPVDMLNKTSLGTESTNVTAYVTPVFGEFVAAVRCATGDDFTFGWQIGPPAEAINDATADSSVFWNIVDAPS